MRSAKTFSLPAIDAESDGVTWLAFFLDERLGSNVIYVGDECDEGKFFGEGNGDEMPGDLALLVESDGRVWALRLRRALTGR